MAALSSLAEARSSLCATPKQARPGGTSRLGCCAQVEVFCYGLSPSDGSEWRLRIEAEAEHFLDVSAWSVPDIARKISADAIQVAINLNGYTKGARNEIFALWPAPVQVRQPVAAQLCRQSRTAREGCVGCCYATFGVDVSPQSEPRLPGGLLWISLDTDEDCSAVSLLSARASRLLIWRQP